GRGRRSGSRGRRSSACRGGARASHRSRAAEASASAGACRLQQSERARREQRYGPCENQTCCNAHGVFPC
ncbi:MAG: hypothetical protein ACK5E0_38465, partial [Bradyrhizobium sp.]